MDPQTLATVGTGAVLLAAIIGALTYARQASRDLRTELKADINQARNDLKQDTEARHAELRADIAALRANLPSPVYLEPAAPRAPPRQGQAPRPGQNGRHRPKMTAPTVPPDFR